MSSSCLSKCSKGLQTLRTCFAPNIITYRGVRCSNAVFSQQEDVLQQVRKVADQNEMDVLQGNTKAAKSYLERVKAHEKFMVEKVAEFSIGRRHLANMMGEDPESFTQEDINRSIAYLFPSNLFEHESRPQMLPPDKVFPSKKEAQYDASGRPYHCFFYTGQPRYFQTMHDIAKHMMELDRHEDKKIQERASVEVIEQLNLAGSVWINKDKFEAMLLEILKDYQYDQFIAAMDRLSHHAYGQRMHDFVMQYRQPLELKTTTDVIPPLMSLESGRLYMTAVGTRKTSKCVVMVLSDGNGHFNINGHSILHFNDPHHREQIIMPLVVCGLVNKVDITCRMEGDGGPTGEAGAIRYAIATALRSFVDEATVERMRISGLLTLDTRRIERKKPGQKGARAKFTWRKR